MRGGEVRAGWREGLWCGSGTTSGMHEEGRTQGLGACAERTENMWFMVVTPVVSKLSGWLKADVYCRVEGRACDAGGRGASRQAGEREQGLWCGWRHDKRQRMHGGGPTQGLGARGTRGAHAEHVNHVRDAGGVEAQRLVEGRRGLPS